MRPFPPRWLLAAALSLAGAAPASAQFRPGPEWRKAFRNFQPTGVAAFPDGHLFTLDRVGQCSDCVAAESATCGHPDRTTLVHLGRVRQESDGQTDWRGKWVVTGLPAGCRHLWAGPGNSLVVGIAGGPYLRLRLALGQAGWQVTDQDLILGEPQRLALGLPPAGPESVAVARDGSLVLGLAGGVALVPPAALTVPARDTVKWLVPLPDPAPKDTGHLEVAVDSAGQVVVLNLAAREAFRVSPATRRRTPVARASQWPARFVPMKMAARGRELVVGGAFGGPAAHAGLVALTPAGGGRYACADLGLDPGFGSLFTFAPEGCLAILSGREGTLRIIEPAPEAGPESPSALEAKAQAAFDALMAESGPVERKSGKPAVPSIRAPGGRASAPPEPAAALPATPEEPEEELSLTELCAGLGLGAPPAAKTRAASRIPAQASASRRGSQAATGGTSQPSIATGPTPTAGPAAPAPKPAGAPAADSWASRVGRNLLAPGKESKAALLETGPAQAGQPSSVPPAAGGAPIQEHPASKARAGEPKAEASKGGEALTEASKAGRAQAWLRRAEAEGSSSPRSRPAGIPEVEAAAKAAAAASRGRTARPLQARMPVPPGVLAHLAEGTSAFVRDARFAAWMAEWRKAGTPPDRPGALDRAKVRLDPAPAGLGPFALPPAAIARAVEWLFLNVRRANHRWDVEDWLAAGGIAEPRFAFGLYLEPRMDRFSLELDDLNDWADWIDGDLGGDPLVTAALARSGGRTGTLRRRDGRLEPTYGLAVTLGCDAGSLDGIRPAGAVYRLPFSQPRFPPDRDPGGHRPCAGSPGPQAGDEPFGMRPMPPLPPLR